MGFSLLDNDPAVHEDDAVDDVGGEARLVGDDNHRRAVARVLLHLRQDLADHRCGSARQFNPGCDPRELGMAGFEFVLRGREVGAPPVGLAQRRVSRVDARLLRIACLIAKYETP
jgi:hypothetical protein